MVKLCINFDMMDKIYQAKGEGILKRNAKIATRTVVPFAIGSAIGGVYSVASGHAEIDQTILNMSITNLSLYLGVLAVTPLFTKGLTHLFGRTPEEVGYNHVEALSFVFNLAGVETTPELLLKTEIYQKKYSLAKSGLPGIIRTRDLEIPVYNAFGKEEITEVEEEHKIGTRKYIITVGGPKKEVKEKVLKPAFSN